MAIPSATATWEGSLREGRGTMKEGSGQDDFLKLAEETKTVCPVSAALAGVEITLDARLK